MPDELRHWRRLRKDFSRSQVLVTTVAQSSEWHRGGGPLKSLVVPRRGLVNEY